MDTTRVSDAERERSADLLRSAVGDGRLTLTEVDERLRTAYAAVTRADLAVVTADLPAPARPKQARAATTGWAGAWRGWLGGALIMIVIWAWTTPGGGPASFWPAIPVGIWAAVLIVSMVTGQRPRVGCTPRR